MEKQRLFTKEDQKLLEEIILHRRDVRGNRFLNKEIPSNELDKILNAGLNAPSVGFSQPWQFVIVTKPDIKEKVKRSFIEENEKAISKFKDEKQQEYIRLKLEGISEAPLGIAVFYHPSKLPVLGQTSMEDMGKFSVICAIQNMWLMARSLNIGLGWVSILDPQKMKTIFNAPQENEFLGYLCLGYTDYFYNKPELETRGWDKRRQHDQVIFKEGF